MAFSLVHKLSIYLVVLTSLASLFTSGELNPTIAPFILLALAVSWFWEEPRVNLDRYLMPWNVITLVFLAKAAMDIVGGESVLVTGVYFIIFLAINKLFNRRQSIDYLQLYVISLLQMISATALTTDISYGLFFLFYIVFSTWTLTLFHLKREVEDNFLLKYADTTEGRPVKIHRVLNSKKLVGGRFLLGTSGVSLIVFAGAATFFLLFPRIGFKLFNQSRAGIAMAGFSDRIELGHFGVIKDNPTVVLRVEFPEPAKRGKLPLYWRGTSFDHYDGTVWSKSHNRNKRTATPPRRGLRHTDLPNPSKRANPSLIKQQIYLEPMESRVAFGLSPIQSIKAIESAKIDLPSMRRSFEIDIEGDLFYEQLDEVAFRYEVGSGSNVDQSAFMAGSLDGYRETMKTLLGSELQRYLQLPNELPDRIRQLAREIVGDAKTVSQAIERVEAHLAQNYRYTLNLKRDKRYPPLEDFLFIQRQGHCEYFSTAMVVLLRAQGIPARNVNGFHGGRWNEFGNYLAVSQGDAHSWVEVMSPSAKCRGRNPCTWSGGWLTRDPTPGSASRVAGGGLWSRLQQYADSLRMRWYKHVIEYDLQQQVGYFLSLKKTWDSVWRKSPEKRRPTGGSATNFATISRWVIGTLLGLVLLTALVLVLRRNWVLGRSAGLDSRRLEVEIALLYGELVALYETLGLARMPHLTAREYLITLEQAEAPCLKLAHEVVGLYESVRFGGQADQRDRIHALRAQVEALAKDVRQDGFPFQKAPGEVDE